MRKSRSIVRSASTLISTVIDAWRAGSAPCELVHGDAVAFLCNYPFKGEELVYADPPYPVETRDGRNRFRHDYKDDDHAALLDILAEAWSAPFSFLGSRHRSIASASPDGDASSLAPARAAAGA